MAGGDARRALNALELAVLSTDPDQEGVIRVDLAAARECMPRRDLMYDRAGEAHYDTVSAFIKSVRGSDVDAALYWLARMLAAGEDPRFIMRRLLILASEDIGLADPQALVQAAAAARALEWVGLPEGQYHLAQATLYLALAPKSNSTQAYFRAKAALEDQGATRVAGPFTRRPPGQKGTGTRPGVSLPSRFSRPLGGPGVSAGGVGRGELYEPGTEGEEPDLAARWRGLKNPLKKSGSPGSQSGEDQ